MDLKWILWSMTLVLGALFFLTYLYSDKLKRKSQLEAAYYELLLARLTHRQDPHFLSKVQEAGRSYGRALGLSPHDIDSMIERDLKSR